MMNKVIRTKTFKIPEYDIFGKVKGYKDLYFFVPFQMNTHDDPRDCDLFYNCDGYPGSIIVTGDTVMYSWKENYKEPYYYFSYHQLKYITSLLNKKDKSGKTFFEILMRKWISVNADENEKDKSDRWFLGYLVDNKGNIRTPKFDQCMYLRYIHMIKFCYHIQEVFPFINLPF